MLNVSHLLLYLFNRKGRRRVTIASSVFISCDEELSLLDRRKPTLSSRLVLPGASLCDGPRHLAKRRRTATGLLPVGTALPIRVAGFPPGKGNFRMNPAKAQVTCIRA
ncbi:hypothetical protein BV25DRAFT_228376 [Artomyces pyxidatus]|uniref:Uncharacterized protein n=1 Tax=Artomyces pyxidatus TaxID=48021 RepID=A0ACB8SFL3_9AGAM|nr:hypothetical protein BV25DRAFT_228376 [Artomyces pyxidatus]